MANMDVDSPTTPRVNSQPKDPFLIPKLPTELITLILSKLDCYFTFLKCQQLSTRFSVFAKDPVLIQNILLKQFPHLTPKNLKLDQYSLWAKRHLKTAYNISKCFYSTKNFDHPAPMHIYAENNYLAILYLVYGSPEIGVWNQSDLSCKTIKMHLKNSNDFSKILVHKNSVFISYLSHNVEIYDLSKGTFIKALENHKISGEIFMSGELLAYCDHSNYNLQKDSSNARIHIVDQSSDFTVKMVPGHLRTQVSESIDCFASTTGQINLWNNKSQEIVNTFRVNDLREMSAEDQMVYFRTKAHVYRLSFKTGLLEGPFHLSKSQFIQLSGKWVIQMNQTTLENWWRITDLSSFFTWEFKSPSAEISKIAIHFPHLLIFFKDESISAYNIQTGKELWDRDKFKGASWIKFENGKLYGMTPNRKKILIFDFK